MVALKRGQFHSFNALLHYLQVYQPGLISDQEVLLLIHLPRLAGFHFYRFQTQKIPKSLAGVDIGEFDLHGDLFEVLIEDLEVEVAANAEQVGAALLHQLDALTVRLLQVVLRRLLDLVLVRDAHETQT